MAHIDIPINAKPFKKESEDLKILRDAEGIRKVAENLFDEERYRDALERTTQALKVLRGFSDFEHTEFRAQLVAVLFDLVEIHYTLKDYKQSEKELEVLFKVLDILIKQDTERFGHLHILAMDLSTRILRSRRKAIELLARQQINTAALYEKVNSGVVAATDKLVDSLRKVAQLLSAAGDYKAALKFYSEAIKFSKKRAGRITRKEVKMTIEMAEIMMRMKSMRPRAKRLLEALLPHAISLGTIELEEDILALCEVIDANMEREAKWKSFLHKLAVPIRGNGKKKETDENLKVNQDEVILSPQSIKSSNNK